MALNGPAIFAVLVHEQPACVADLVANLRYLDPDSVILLYNGGTDPDLIDPRLLDDRVIAVPGARTMRWGRLHDFALDCMRFALEHFDVDALTIVDSDQLALRSGYAGRIADFLRTRPRAGLLGNAPYPQPRRSRIGPVPTAWQEVELWRPLLRRLPAGNTAWPHWTFWPSTVFTAGAARDLVELFDDAQLLAILAQSKIWATEEIILPTLVAALGWDVVANPCLYDVVRYRVTYTRRQVDAAMGHPDTYWIHPVARRVDDPLRSHIRSRLGGYRTALRRSTVPTLDDPASAPRRDGLLLTLPILGRMETIDGWFSRAEGDLLIAATARALTTLPTPHQVVEIGSYCGRSTVALASAARAVSPGARVHAIDPHEGRVGTADGRARSGTPTFDRFLRTLAEAGIDDVVEPVRACSFAVEWDDPISLLLIDGLHDYPSVATDLSHFERHVVEGAYVAFHDYADYYPGVKALVDQLVAFGWYEPVARVESLAVLRKRGSVDLVPLHPILERMEGVEGWLEADEASLLALVCGRALSGSAEAIVEVGSYCGRGTIVLASVAAARSAHAEVYAIDRFDGTVGAADDGLLRGPPTLGTFRHNIETAGLGATVREVEAAAPEVEWSRPIGLLLIDGLHDYEHVAADFHHLQGHVVEDGFVAFHDYADYYPGVRRLVDEILAGGGYELVAHVRSLVVLRKHTHDEAAPPLSARVTGGSRPADRAAVATGPHAAADHGDDPRVVGGVPTSDGGAVLVSCIMPTLDRRQFVPRAIDYFLRQDYPNRELVVIDDGSDPVEDLMPDDPRIRYIRLGGRRTIGAKRNIGCEQAAGGVLTHWDDDDWVAPWRLRYQVEQLAALDAEIVGLDTLLYFDPATDTGWRYRYLGGHRSWVHDPTFCYRREVWESARFPDANYGLDVRYLAGHTMRVRALADPGFYVGILHQGNTSPKRTTGRSWERLEDGKIEAVLGSDYATYAATNVTSDAR